MNNDDLIYKKIQGLQETGEAINQPAQEGVASNPELANEMAFIEAFWHDSAQPIEHQPSDELKSRFYQALAEREPEQTARERSPDNFWSRVGHWLVPMKPAMQFALMLLVFVAGMGTESVLKPHEDASISKLQTQVEQLNSMVALSLLQQTSAAERLSGVAYSARSEVMSSRLQEYLMQLLVKDKSTAVRLAIVDAMAGYEQFSRIENRLLEALFQQDNALVQLHIIDLLFRSASRDTVNRLVAMATDERLLDEVQDELFKRMNKQRI